MHNDLSDLNKVWEIKPVKMAGENEARKILENVAKQVQPIMYRRKWKVQVLSEFCPPNPALMGLNIDGGAEIKLRLRRQERQWDFFNYEQILDTMLHELCHNEHGPHNADFYKLLDELRLECEELMAKGVTGTGKGFDLPGQRLSGFSQPPPLPLLRKHALAAAERRAQRETLLPSGPRRLGGNSSIKAALSPNQAAAMAAERRLHDDLWCGSTPPDGVRNQTDKASSSTNYGPPQDFTWPANPPAPVSSLPSDTNYGVGSQAYNASSSINYGPPQDFAWPANPPAPVSSLPSDTNYGVGSQAYNASSSINYGPPQDFAWPANPPAPVSSLPSWQGDENSGTQGTWQCDACTLINKALALTCDACQIPRSEEVDLQNKNWSCKFCTLINNNGLEKCSACGEWRYSHGPPATGYTPHIGT